MTDLPFLFRDICPDCGHPLLGVVHRVVGTPRANGWRMEVPIEKEITWMMSCAHISEEEIFQEPDPPIC